MVNFSKSLTGSESQLKRSSRTFSSIGPAVEPLRIIERPIDRMSVIEQATNPLSQFRYALKAPETKRQWPNRLKVVFDFLGLAGNLDEQAQQFITLCKEGDTASVQDKIIGFISYQVQRAQKGEISLSTIPNYLKAMKLFCEMNDIYVRALRNR